MIKTGLSFPSGRAGYTLVEMAIVLAVLGLLMGSILLPLSARYKGEQLQATREQLERVENAIFGYALRNSTKPAQAELAVGTRIRTTPIPGGRPYLPCPDISGDGLENRITPIQAHRRQVVHRVLSVPSNPVSIALAVDASSVALLTRTRPESLAATVTLTNTRADNNLVRDANTPIGAGSGACVTDKGWVPWATLGVPPADIWGNRITYRVDPMFANSVIGFGHETRSDPFDPRMPLTLHVPSSGITLTVYQRRSDDYANTTTNFRNRRATYFTDESPGIVCNTYAQAPGCSPYFDQDNNNPDELLNEATTADLTLFDVYPNITIARLYEEEDIVNGMAFVLVSHGPNGHGAIQHYVPQGIRPRCRSITADLNNPETENADFRSLCTATPTRPNPLGAVDTPAAHTGVRHHSFVSLSPHSGFNNNTGYVFDDELRFATGDELIAKLAGLGRKFGGPWIPPVHHP